MFILLGIFEVVRFIISLLPDFSSMPSWLSEFLTMAGYALNFIPGDVWVITLANVALWKFGLIAWGIVEWVYKKIPGVS